MRDVRVAVPEPDPEFIDLVTDEMVVQSGEEKIFCQYYDLKLTGPVAATNGIGLQGKAGHHVVVLSTTKPKPHGLVEDCSDEKSMIDLQPLVIPVELPDGHAVWIENQTIVVQFHYVNTFPEPILVRDVFRLQTVPVDSVDHWVATFVTNDALFDVPVGETGGVSFDCRFDDDFEILLMGGHLHEWGTKFEILLGPDTNNLEQMYLVDPWRSEYRDTPPVELFLTSPLAVPKGTIIRTRCQWENTTDGEIDFPVEMCAVFGYVRGTKTGWSCDSGGVLGDTERFIERRKE